MWGKGKEKKTSLDARILIISASNLHLVEKAGMPDILDGDNLRMLAYKSRETLIEKIAKTLYEYETPKVCLSTNDWDQHSEAYKAIYYRSAEHIVNAIAGPPAEA